MMVASNSETISNQTSRHPLLSSENDHGVITVNNSPRPKSRNTSSKYISPSPSHSTSSNSNSSSVPTPTPSRRSPSPLVSRNSTTPASKRSVSADRRRPTTPDRNLKRNNAGKEMSSAAKLLVTSTKFLSVSFQGDAFSLATNLNNVQKGTRKTKPMDQQRWPHMTHQASNTVFSKSLSLDCAVEKSKVIKPRNMIRALHQSIDGGRRSSLDLGKAATPRSKFVTSPTVAHSRKFSSDGPLSSPSTMRPRSPSVLMTSSMRSSSPMRELISPIRNSGTITTESPSVLSFSVDGRRRKVGENRIVNAHLLGLLYNRELQWRFVNARTEDILLKRKHRTEKYIWNTWVTTSDLHNSVTKKRHRLQLVRQKMKLYSILKEQMGFLENWVCLDKEHSRSLRGAIEALKASILHLPVGDGAIADIENMREAISLAMAAMQEMGPSICSLCLKADEVNSSVKELANLSAKERTLVRICKDLLSMLMALKVKDCSLRTHTLQKICV